MRQNYFLTYNSNKSTGNENKADKLAKLRLQAMKIKAFDSTGLSSYDVA
jgi:hypothetical protein